jgi:Ca2+-transporting ATPase
MAKISWHNLPVEEIIKILGTNLKKGLTEKEVNTRLVEFGENKLPEERPLSKLKIFLAQFQSPLIYILIVAGIITLILREFTDSIVIFGAVILNTIVGYFQESKASRALQELKKVVKYEAQVIRNGNIKIIESSELVPGDVFILNPGNKVPADGRILESHNLKINEMTLTGEWLPAKKNSDILPKDCPLADRDNMVYMGTIVEDGIGKAVVTETGLMTEIGRVAKMVKETKEEKTPLQKKLARFSKIIGGIIGIIALFIFIEGIITGNTFLEMFTTSVAVAVAAIPEGLPVALTVILALGMQRILKRRGLVRKLLAAETLGSTSVIATDKTLTLTEGRMEVAEIFTLSNKKNSKDLVFKIATLANEAFIENPQDPQKDWRVRGRPTEKALLIKALQAGFKKREIEQGEEKIDEIPFDPVRKYGATLHKISESTVRLYLLGAPERLLELSKIEPNKLRKFNQKLENLTRKGYRVIGTAYREIRNPKAKIQNLEEYCQDLNFVGLIALRDPLRKDVKVAIKTCIQAGMRPIIVTGDHKLTARAIANELGFKITKESILEGKNLDTLSDKELEKRLERIKVFARVEPRHKIRIIEAWQKKGEVVAMTGDGINDAPALKRADIGVALGSGTEVAKETSDLILLNDSFSIIVAAIEEGRAILDNIRKVITYLLSDSFTEIILIGTSLLLGWPLPVVAVQILWVNLIEDGPLGLCLAFEPKEKDIMHRTPQGHDIPLLTQEMKALIFVIGLVTDLLLLGLLFWLIKYSGYEIPHIRSIIFAGLTIDSIFYIFSCKSLRRNLWQINPFANKFLVFAWIFSVIMLLTALYFSPLQTLLKTVPLTLFDWQLILALGFLNIFLIEATKWHFISRQK